MNLHKIPEIPKHRSYTKEYLTSKNITSISFQQINKSVFKYNQVSFKM